MLQYNDSDSSRLIEVLEGKIPDRIPYMDFTYSREITEKILGRKIELEHQKVIFENGIADEYGVNKNDTIDLCYAIGQDVVNHTVWSPEEVWSPEGLLAENGKIISRAPGKIKNLKDFKKIEFTDPSEFDKKYKNDFLNTLNYASKYNIGTILITGPFFQDTHMLMGWENFMHNVIDDIDFIREVMYRFSEYYYELVKYFCRFDLTALFFTDNIACNSGSFISPKLFKEIYIPLLKKVISPAKDKQIPMIFDSDGDIEWMIDEIIELGFDAIHPIDPGGMDIYRIKEKYGKTLTIMGNVGQDYPLSRGTVREVEEDIRKRISALGNGGRYVLKSSHDIGDNVKPENFTTMIETLHKYGYYK